MANDRPRAVRNLMAEFDALSELPAPVDGVPVEATTPVDGVPAEDAAERERVLAEREAEAERQRFKEAWGYDVVRDEPVEGGRWEYEQIHPPPPGLPPAQEDAVVEAPREP